MCLPAVAYCLTSPTSYQTFDKMVDDTSLERETTNTQDKQDAAAIEDGLARGPVNQADNLEKEARIKELESELANLKKAELAKPTGDAEQILQKSNLSEDDLAKIKEYAIYSARMKAANEVLIAAGQPPFLIQPPPNFGPIPAQAPIAIDLTGIGVPEDKVRAHQQERTNEEESAYSSARSGNPSATKAKKSVRAKPGARKRSPTPPRRDSHHRLEPKNDAPRDAVTHNKAKAQTAKQKNDEDEVHTGSTRRGRSDREFEDLKNIVMGLQKDRKVDSREPRAAMEALARSLLEDLPRRQISNVTLTDYAGTSDPYEWLATFESKMYLASGNGAAKCVALVGSMKGKASSWLRGLPEGSIRSWEDMRSKFLEEFKNVHQPCKDETNLFMLKQDVEESSKSYLDRFNQVYEQTRDVADKTVMMAFKTGLQSGNLKTLLAVHPPANLREMLEQARKYSTVEPLDPRGRIGSRGPQTDFATDGSQLYCTSVYFFTPVYQSFGMF